ERRAGAAELAGQPDLGPPRRAGELLRRAGRHRPPDGAHPRTAGRILRRGEVLQRSRFALDRRLEQHRGHLGSEQMSDAKGANNDPSMDDILASIRKIISDDEARAQVNAGATPSSNANASSGARRD